LTFLQAQEGVPYPDAWAQYHVEPLYYFLNVVGVRLGLDLHTIIAITGIIFLVFIYCFIIDQSERIPLSLLLLVVSNYFLFSLTGIRQAAATGIVFYALKYAKSRRPIPYFALVTVACGFHLSALLFAPLYFAVHVKIGRKTIAGLAICVVALLASPSIVRGLMSLFYSGYIGSKYDYTNASIIPFVICLLLVAVAYFVRDSAEKRSPYFRIHFNITVLNAAIMSLTSIIITGDRFYLLLLPAALIVVPSIVESVRVREPLLVPIVGVALSFVLFAYMGNELVQGNDTFGVWAYSSVFDKNDHAMSFN